MSIFVLDGIYFVNIVDIVCFEVEDNYIYIYFKSGECIIVFKIIKAYEDLLVFFNFYWVYKCYVINLNFMWKFVKGDGGYFVMDDDI